MMEKLSDFGTNRVLTRLWNNISEVSNCQWTICKNQIFDFLDGGHPDVFSVLVVPLINVFCVIVWLPNAFRIISTGPHKNIR